MQKEGYKLKEIVGEDEKPKCQEVSGHWCRIEPPRDTTRSGSYGATNNFWEFSFMRITQMENGFKWTSLLLLPVLKMLCFNN